MARLGRTVYVTHCKGIGFDENNEQFIIDVDVPGNVKDLNKANYRVRKLLKNDKVLVKEIETTAKYYSMTVENFIKYADMVTDRK